ncbi:hypothetical protein [Enterococcus timonensis]|uniref:hypothetical protein n=1 Tax=Enterococcus timonensis TaxID=1852364 RepID=UPI0008DA0D46|nr:hypothetical protein [Enterococcus timonensis]
MTERAKKLADLATDSKDLHFDKIDELEEKLGLDQESLDSQEQQEDGDQVPPKKFDDVLKNVPILPPDLSQQP